MDRKVPPPPQHQVFINFRGDELRKNFISHLVEALQRSEINFFTDKQEKKGEDLSNLFNRIEESKIALAVFSKRYTESRWCLDELVKIKERADLGKLKVRSMTISYISIFLSLYISRPRPEPIPMKQWYGDCKFYSFISLFLVFFLLLISIKSIK